MHFKKDFRSGFEYMEQFHKGKEHFKSNQNIVFGFGYNNVKFHHELKVENWKCLDTLSPPDKKWSGLR